MIATAPTTRGPLVVFAGGGTGGHLYPAIAIAEAIRERLRDVRFAFYGTRRRIDQRILGSIDCEAVQQDLSPLSKAPWRWPGFYWRLRSSRTYCRERFAADRPSVIVGTGGLASVPAVHAGVGCGIPAALLNPDAMPGKANRHLSRLADVIFAQWDDTVAQYPRGTKVVVAGCAIRPAFGTARRSDGIACFGLDPTKKTLLVTGASQGARTINEAVAANARLLAELADWQVLHLTGEGDHAYVSDAYRAQSLRAQVVAYTDRMAEALAAADLVVSRAGASTLAEITAVGRASILLPYPYDRHQHQRANARCLVRAGAARLVNDASDPGVNGPALRETLQALMTCSAERERMAAAAQCLGRGTAAADIAEQLIPLAGLSSAVHRHESVQAR